MKTLRQPSDFVTIILMPENRYELRCSLQALANAKCDTPHSIVVLGLNPGDDLKTCGRMDMHANLVYKEEDGKEPPIVHKLLQLFCMAVKNIHSKYVVYLPDRFVPGDYWLDQLMDYKSEFNIVCSHKAELYFNWENQPYEKGFFFENFSKDVTKMMSEIFKAQEGVEKPVFLSNFVRNSVVLFDLKPIKDGLEVPLAAWLRQEATLNDVLADAFMAKGRVAVCVNTSVVTEAQKLDFDLPRK